MQISDLVKIHAANSNTHFQGEHRAIQLSLDGVSESKSTNTSLDVYSVKFEGCRDVYPLKIIRPLNKYPIDSKKQLAEVLQAILRENIILKSIVADNPKRSFLRDSLQHSGKFGCEYCFQSGVPFSTTSPDESSAFLQCLRDQQNGIKEQLNELIQNNDTDTVQIEALTAILKSLEEAEKLGKKQKKSSHIVWPAYTFDGEMRTKEKILEIVNQIEENENMSQSEKKGIKGRSLLLAIDYFDYVFGISTEYMHSTSLGLVKRMLELTFSVGETRYRNIKRPLTPPAMFNDLMKNVKVFKECSRRARKLDLAVMKAQELRNILILFFPLITKCLTGHDKEIRLWEMLAFMIRACILPEAEYQNVNVNSIKYCQKNYYLTYQHLFGTRNCTYSVHVVSSHVGDMRKYGPLTETSAFRFKNFYAELRNSFKPGTVSVVKQMFQNFLLKRIISNHVCCEKIYLREKDTAMECNSLIYTYENNNHVIYKIKAIENDNLICNQLGNHPVQLPNTSTLNWSSVGVYRKGGLCSLDVIVPRKSVAGKVIKVDVYLITCPANVLREK